MLSRIRIRTKLGMLLAMFAVSLTFILAMDAAALHRRMLDDRIEKLRTVTDIGLSLLAGLERKVARGELAPRQELPALRALMHDMRYDEGHGYLSLQSFGGIILIHGIDAWREDKPSTTKDQNGKSLLQLVREEIGERESGTISYLFPKPGQAQPERKISYIAKVPRLGGFFIVGTYVDDLQAAYLAQLIKIGAAGGSTLLVIMAITWLVNRDIAGSLGRLERAMARLANGDSVAEIPGTGRRDEVGSMAAAVKVFRDSARQMDRLKADQATAEHARITKKKADMERLAAAFEASVSGLVSRLASSASDMKQTAATMSDTADQTARQANSVAAASEEASANVNAVAIAAEELSASVHEIGQQVSASYQTVSRAVEESDRTNTLIRKLAEAAEKIGAVTRIIQTIAGQTKLLALNATIEAASAGDAGMGFAVVASEVKSLATQTAAATEAISAHIGAMQSVAGDTVLAIEAIGGTIGRINDISGVIAAAVEEQGVVTQEIARSVREAAAGTQMVSVHIAGVTRAAAGTGGAATRVLGASAELAEQADALGAQVGSFLAVVNAA